MAKHKTFSLHFDVSSSAHYPSSDYCSHVLEPQTPIYILITTSKSSASLVDQQVKQVRIQCYANDHEKVRFKHFK